MAKNIALLTTSYLPIQGGVQYLLYWLLKEIDVNYETYQKKFCFKNIYLIIPKYQNSGFDKFDNIKVLNISEVHSKIGKIRFIFQTLFLIKKYKLNTVHSHNAYLDSIPCNIAFRVFGTKYVITSHGEDLASIESLNYGLDKNSFAHKIVKNNIFNARAITTVSTDMCKFALQYKDESRVFVVRNSLPYSSLKETYNENKIQSHMQKIRSEYKLSDSNIVCLTLSGSRKIKGHKNMLLGFQKAYQKNCDLRLFIAAHGNETNSLIQLVEDLGLLKVVYFIGFIKSEIKEAFFRVSHIYVNTAYFEPFGLVYLEAIQSQLANLATVAGGAKDIFEHEKSAYLIDPNSINEIYQGFLYLSKEENRDSLINNASKILPHYTTNQVVTEYFKVYQKI